MSRWLNDLASELSCGQSSVSIAVASTRGSVPREAGTRMVVTPAQVFGTIGGGHLEFKAIQIARDMLASPGTSSLRRFPLGASLGQCCGGLVNLLFEPVLRGATWVDEILRCHDEGRSVVAVTPARGSATTAKLLVTVDRSAGSLGSGERDREAIVIARQRLVTHQSSTLLALAGEDYFFETIPSPDFEVVLFGAGHVGRAMVRILAELPCSITWIDGREEEFPAELPCGVEKRVSDSPQDEVARARAGSYFLVMSHSHQLDQVICEQILLRRDFAYFGLIGSLSKRRQFERRMLARGIPEDRFGDMVCPIGTGTITSKEPMAIAVGVVSQLLQRREALTRMATIAAGPVPVANVRQKAWR